MQTTAIRTVANSLPEKGVILLTLLISDRYILFAELKNILFLPSPVLENANGHKIAAFLDHRLKKNAYLCKLTPQLITYRTNLFFHIYDTE